MELTRDCGVTTVTVGATAGASTEIDVARFAGGSFQFPSDTGTTQVTLYATISDGTYGIAYDEDGVSWVRTVVPGAPMAFPSFMHAFASVKLVASGGDPDTDVPIFVKA